jgi:hypothetical protein
MIHVRVVLEKSIRSVVEGTGSVSKSMFYYKIKKEVALSIDREVGGLIRITKRFG